RPRWRIPAAAFAIGVVAVEWTAATITSFERGIRDFDSQSYHLPFAARFVESGWITELHHIYYWPQHAFYPANVELLHAVGMTAWTVELVSPFMNLGFVALALLAAWSIGEHFHA